jgi:hypothetical protein
VFEKESKEIILISQDEVLLYLLSGECAMIYNWSAFHSPATHDRQDIRQYCIGDTSDYEKWIIQHPEYIHLYEDTEVCI